MALYITQSTDNQVNLTLENNNDFKLLIKEKSKLRDSSNYTSCFESIKCDSNILELNKNTNIHDDIYFVNEESNSSTILKKSTIEYTDVNDNNGKSMHHLNEFKHDLQSLLIMMAINSKIDENEDTKNILAATKQEDTKNIVSNETDCVHTTFKSSNNDLLKDLKPLLNITSLRKDCTSNELFIAKKYIMKWKIYVKNKKENDIFIQRQETLNNFFDKLSKRKSKVVNNIESVQRAKLFAQDYGTYQHRYKVQKHIIALQKSKLEEQNKLIERLKYNKILEASQQSLDVMKEDVRKTYYEIDKHLKPKIKCLTNELKIKEIEEPSLVLHCLKVPQFLQRMEKRAREREEKHAMIRERRKQLEEERIKQKQQAELAKLEIDKEEKMKKIKELREKRKKEKIENIRKKQHFERLRALIVMADLHYENKLMKNYGIRPLKRLIEIKHDNIEKAKAHYRFQLLKNIFLHWMWYTEDMWFDRNYKAEDFYRKKILTKYLSGFKKNHYEFVLKKQVAEDYYDLYVTQLVFKQFCKGIELIKKEYDLKLKKALLFYNSNILFKTFTCWRTLPALNALKREQDARKLRWREKVLLVVPDYEPPED